jgi:hypothetical protein
MIPALILGYSRPLGIQELLTSLIGSGVDTIYISIDGVKNSERNDSHQEIKKIVASFRIKEPGVQIALRLGNKNYGAGIAVVSGIDWFFKNENVGMILEDDLRISKSLPSYFDYLITSRNILSEFSIITGTNYANNNSQFSFSTYPIIWGWATSSSNWKLMRADMISPQRFQARNLFSASKSFWLLGKLRALSGEIDAWDVPLAGEFHFLKRKCLIPPVNLVKNIGFDNSATHTTEEIWPLNLKLSEIEKQAIDSITKFDDLECVDKFLERRIFKIRFHHGLTYLVALTKAFIGKRFSGTNYFIRQLKEAEFSYE